MHAASSQLAWTTGSTTRRFDVVTSSPTRLSVVPVSQAPLLAAYAVGWLESIAGQVRPRTLEGYRYRLERHVLPRLGDHRLDEIGVEDVLDLINDLRERGYSGWSIRSVLTPLSRLFSHAVRRDVIVVSPVTKLDRSERPSVWRREQRILNREEIGRLLESAPTRYRTLIATAILSGLRQSELLALRWRDVDFSDQVIHVRGALDRHGHDVPTKTRHALRAVVLMPALATRLAEHRAGSPFKDEDDFVFSSLVGTPLHWRNISRRGLAPALKKAGIAPIRWHDMRHVFASLLVAGGANIAFVSRQLGHGSPAITLGIYAHLFDGAEQAQRTREMLQEMLGSVV